MRTRRLLLASLLAAAVAGSAWAQSATGGVAGSASGAGNYGISGSYGGANAVSASPAAGSSSGIGLGGASIGDAGASASYGVGNSNAGTALLDRQQRPAAGPVRPAVDRAGRAVDRDWRLGVGIGLGHRIGGTSAASSGTSSRT
jgi:hypothetical protein